MSCRACQRVSFFAAARCAFRAGVESVEHGERLDLQKSVPHDADAALQPARQEIGRVQSSPLITPALKAEHAAEVCRANSALLGQPTVATLKAKYSPQLAQIVAELEAVARPPQREWRAATAAEVSEARSPEGRARVNAALHAERLDASPVGQATQAVFDKKLSAAKQHPLGTLGANTLESGQSLATAVAHPARTLDAIGQFLAEPRYTVHQIADAYHDEWLAAGTAGKVGLVWRGLLDFVIAPATIAKGVSAVSSRVAATASEVGMATANAAGQVEKTASVGNVSQTVGVLEAAGAAVAHEKITDAVAAAQLIENARTLAATSPREAVQQLNSVSPDLLRQQPELAEQAYQLRQEVLRRNREVFSYQTYTKDGAPGRKPEWEYIADSANWLPERAALQAEVTQQTYETAVQLSERMPPKTILLLRGNTASGKTTVLRTEMHPIVKELHVLDKNGQPSGVINPDVVKASLREADKLNGEHTVSHYQMLAEGAKIAGEVTQKMLAEGRSAVIDKRFLKPNEITEIAAPAEAAGYRVVVLDVDASLESSLARAENRTFEGEDPVVDAATITKGYHDATKYRPAVKNLPNIDYIYLKND